MRYNKKKKNLGGTIGMGLGALAGTALGNPMIGAQIGRGLGNFAGKKLSENNNNTRSYKPAASTTFGLRHGGLVEFEGPSHEQGGIPLEGGSEVEGGETMESIQLQGKGNVKKNGQNYVFSKTLKVPGSNMSFAKYHKQLKKRGADEDQIRKLAMMQEKVSGRVNKSSNTGDTRMPAMRGNKRKGGLLLGSTRKNNPYSFADSYRWYRKGGSTKKKYQTGGPSPFLKKDLDAVSLTGMNSPSSIVDRVMADNTANPELKKYAVSPAQSNSSAQSQEGNDTLGTALQLAPDMVNFATGAFGKDKTKPATEVSNRSVNMMRDRVNISPQLRDLKSGYRSIASSPYTTNNQRLAAQSNLQKGLSRTYANKFNQETQLRNQKASMQGRIDQANARFREQERQDRMASEANLGISGNFARQSLSSMANKLLQMKRDQKLSERDKEMIQMMVEGYGASPSHTNYLRNLVGSYGQ